MADTGAAAAGSQWLTPDPLGVIDLHLHTTTSDGSETPRRLFEMAKDKQLRAIGFCDHDSIGAVREGLELSKEFGIEFVPGCEIGISHDPARGLVETDLVAYYYDPAHQELIDTLALLRKAKNQKLDRQLSVLATAGFSIPRDEVVALAKGETIRRPHIFAVIQRHFPELSADQFYNNSDFGGIWYVGKDYNLSLEDCVALIKRAGGITVLSSPGSYNDLYKKSGQLLDSGVDRLVETCAAAGVEGLETIYTYRGNKPYFKNADDTINQNELETLITHYENLADRLGLVKTGGSDYHGLSKPQIAIGEIPVPYRYLVGLKRAVGRSS